jgi:hypothetical protein
VLIGGPKARRRGPPRDVTLCTVRNDMYVKISNVR